MTATFLQPLGSVTAGQQIVLARPEWTVTGTYDVESLEHVDAGKVHLKADRVDSGDPQRVDDVFPGDRSVGIVAPQK
jgi:hypothetical protein